MPVFLNRSSLYRMIQRELPIDAYPDGPSTAFYSTSDSDATAKVLATAYSNLERIYENHHPQTADEKQVDWENLIFNRQLDATLTLQQRRDRVLAKIRTRRRCTPEDLKQTVYTIIDSSILVEIVEWNCHDGSWVLDESELDISTVLSGQNPFVLTGPDLCTKVAADFGLTEEEFEQLQEEAYTYEVRIYDYTLTAAELDELDKALTSAEPARSQHVISDGLDSADAIGGGS